MLDHADALLTVLTQGRVGTVLHPGGENEVSSIDLVRAFCAILDVRQPAAAPMLIRSHLSLTVGP
jgi:dTDP-glucose 4,6-dehydratase